jgi:hypothetical protein
MSVAIRHSRQKVTLVLLMLTCQLAISCGHSCRTIVEDSLGSFDSAETGARAAVPRLSQEIHRCGEANKYSVSWKFPPGGHEIGWRALIYVRKDKTSGVVGYEDDPGSGFGSETYWVEDSAVDQVAREGGVLKDFAKYSKGKPF